MRHRRLLGWLAVSLLLTGLLVAAQVEALRHTRILITGTGSVAGGPCGGETPLKADGTPWRCTFDDEFSGPALDPAKWQPLASRATGFHSGAECYVPDARHVRVSGGALLLTTTREPLASPCGNFDAQYLSGMVTTTGRFSQAFGRIEFRARFPAGTGLQQALWLYPAALTYGPWPGSGEIDVAEAYGSHPDVVSPHLHYAAPGGLRAAPGTACRVAGAATAFHTYTAEWTPAGISFRYDRRLCWSIDRWTPAAPLSFPAPFDRPFTVLITAALGKQPPDLPGPGTPASATMAVDYVRVWR